MPDPDDLPEHLRPIVRGAPRTLTLEGFGDEVRELVEHVNSLLPSHRRPAIEGGAGFG
jgi:hypothetical protein